MSETENEKIRKMVYGMVPQVNLMANALKPLQSMMESVLKKYGIEVYTNKVVWFKDKNIVMFGVQLKCPNSYIAEQVALNLTGKSLTLKEKEKEVEIDVGEKEKEGST